MARNRKLQNRIGLPHITDEAEAAIASSAFISAEQVEDYVGDMLDGTETFITVGYDDTNGNLDFIVQVKDEDNMASNSAVYLATQQSVKAYVDNEVAGVVDSSPAALNTLNELAAALGDDANYAATTTTLLGNRLRVDTAAQGLSTTQQSNALLNMGITASKAELNILDSGLSASDIPNLGAAKITSGTFATARIADNAITAGKLFVSGNGSSTQFLRSDGDGTFSWVVPTNTNTQLSQEQVEDYVDDLLTAGSNITINYVDAAGTLTISSQDTTYTSSDFTHDNLTGVSANKHIDWTANGAGTIHASNYLNTTYSVGDGGLTQINFTSADNTKLDGIATSANNYVLPFKDEDNMASNSATHVSSQQSIKTYVDSQVSGLIDSSPAALNTLNELAAALNDDASFSTTITTSIGTKLAKASNLSDLANAGTARTNLGLGTAATLSGTGAVANSNAGLVTGDTVYDYIEGQGFGSGSGDITSVVAGTGLSGGATSGDATLNLQLSEFSVSTTDGDGDYFIVNDTSHATKRLTKANINLSGFNNDSGFATLTGSETLTNKTLTTPNLGTPSAIVLTNATGTATNLAVGSATNVVTAAENSSGSWFKIPFVAAATGSQQLKTDSGLEFRPSANKLSVGGDFSLTGNIILEDGSGYVKLGGSNSNALRFYDDDSSHYATIKQPSTIGANYTLTLPTTDGNANQFLRTDGSGALSWADYTSIPLLDEDNMASNSATAAASQQSIKAYVDTEVAGIVDSAPAALDTLNELAAALGDDANYAATTTTAIGLKLAKASNLSDLANAGTARTNLGLGAAAVKGVATDGAGGVANGEAGLVTGNAVYDYVAANPGGDSWGTVVDADIIPDTNNTRTLGSSSKRFGIAHILNSYIDLLSSANGSAPYPTYTFAADENTGMYRGGTDILGFSTAGTSRITIGADGAVNFVASKIKLNNSYGSDGQVLTSTGSGVAWEAAGSGGISNVVEDTTPQLGGILDTQAYAIQSSGTKTIISPGSGGGNQTVSIGDDSTNPGTLRVGSNGTNNQLPLAVSVKNSSNTNQQIAAYFLAGNHHASTRGAGFGPIIELRASSGTAYSGQLSGKISTKQIGTGESTNHDLHLEAGGTGAIRFNDEFSFPAADGSANQVLQTDGNGTLTWATSGGGASAITGLSDATTSASSVWLGSTPSNATDYNTAVGIGALDALNGTNGTKNVAIGQNAGTANTEGFKNVFIGFAAGAANTNADANVFIGSQAGSANTTGSYNTGIGTNALSQVTTVTNNTALGYYAGKGIQNGGNNVAIGESALSTNNSAAQNTAVGASSQKSNSGGNSNTSLGYRTLYGLTTGLRNIAIGTQALDSTTTESDNIAIGFEALYNPNGAAMNVVIGNYAGDGITTGSGNIILGHQAGGRLTTSGNNIVIGKQALDWATTGWGHNIVIGSDAMGQSATTGGRNIAIGSFALKANTSDYGNVAVGYNALSSATSHNNTAVGDQAGKAVTSGGNNTIFGWNAGYALTSGASNIFVGKEAGDNITTGSNNVVIGKADADATGSDQLVISSGDGSPVWIMGYSDGSVNLVESKLKLGGSFGSDGQVLTSTGSGAAWESAGGGGASTLNDLTDVTSNITNFTNSILISPDGAAPPTGTLSSASSNVGIGTDVFKDLTSGTNIVAIGHLAGENLTNGGHEVLIGMQAGSELTSTQFNTLVGYRAGKNTKGAYNVALGATALQGHGSTWHTGDWNVAIGHAALAEVQGDSDGNIAIGRSALTTLTTGDTNIAIGYEAAREMTTGGNNVLIGREAGQKMTTGSSTVAVGDNAGRFNTGSNNTFVGMNAGKRGTEGSSTHNTMIGNSAGGNNTGDRNTVMGHQALIYGTGGADNVALGYYAGQRITGTGVVAIGSEAAMNLTSGGTSVAIGYRALKSATSSQQQVAIGNGAGEDITTGNFNTLVGNYSGRKITTGYQNVALGFNTMNAASSTAMTGSSNTAVGGNVMEDITSGTNNVGMGYNTLREITTGARNTALGGGALDGITTINDNTGVGYAALGGGSMTGGANTAVGAYAGDAITSGTNNVVLGYMAGSKITSGNHNTYIGYKAGEDTTTATESIGIGDYALADNTTGGGNVAIGHQALRGTTTGLRNTAVGMDAGYLISSGQRNSAFGEGSLRAATTGHFNIAVGYTAGNNITEGTGNVVIGQADVPSATGDKQLSISAGSSSTPVWLTGNSSGVVDFPNGITSGGAAVGGAAYPHEIKTAGVNWYGNQLNDIRINALPPFGTKASSTCTFSTSSDYDKPMFYPFVAPKTGTINRVNAYAQTGAAGLNLIVGFYSDHNGYPATLLFKGTMDASSGGNKTITAFTDASDNSTTPTLTKNTQYHVGWVRDDNGVSYNFYTSNAAYTAGSGLNLNMSDGYVGQGDVVGQYGGSSNVLATSYNSGSPDWDDFTVFNASIKPISFGMRYA